MEQLSSQNSWTSMFKMEDVLVAKIGSMCILGGLSLFFGLIPIKIVEKFGLANLDKKGKSSKTQITLTALNCFGAGVILTTCFTHMLPEVNEVLRMGYKDGSLTKPKVPLAEILVICGFLMIYLIEEIAHLLLHTFKLAKDESTGNITSNLQQTDSESTIATSKASTELLGQQEEFSVQCVCGRQLKCATMRACAPKNPQSTDVLANIKKVSFQVAMRGFFIMLAISLHAVFEGIAMGLGKKASMVWYLCFAIAIHKFIIAFCIGLQMTTSGMKKALVFAYMGTFSLITPVGIAIGIGLFQSASNNSASNGPAAVLNGLAAGTLIYVVFFEILEKERQKKSNGLLQVSFIILGFIVMICVQFIEGDHHHHQKPSDLKEKDILSFCQRKNLTFACANGNFSFFNPDE